MKKNLTMGLVMIFLYQFICFSCINKYKDNENNTVKQETNDNHYEFNNELEIKLHGYYSIASIEYIFKINKNLLSIKDGIIEYKKIVSGTEMQNIYNYIKKSDLIGEIKLRNGWIGSEGFYGELEIKIDNEIYIKEIFDGQDENSDVYKILHYINLFATEGYGIPFIENEKSTPLNGKVLNPKRN